MSERTQVTDKIRKLITGSGGKIVKTHGGGYTEKGTPDVLGCYRGLTIAIECKKKGGDKPTPIQCKRLIEWGEAGAIAVAADDVKQVTAILNDIDDSLNGGKFPPVHAVIAFATAEATRAGAVDWLTIKTTTDFRPKGARQ